MIDMVVFDFTMYPYLQRLHGTASKKPFSGHNHSVYLAFRRHFESFSHFRKRVVGFDSILRAYLDSGFLQPDKNAIPTHATLTLKIWAELTRHRKVAIFRSFKEIRLQTVKDCSKLTCTVDS